MIGDACVSIFLFPCSLGRTVLKKWKIAKIDERRFVFD